MAEKIRAILEFKLPTGDKISDLDRVAYLLLKFSSLEVGPEADAELEERSDVLRKDEVREREEQKRKALQSVGLS